MPALPSRIDLIMSLQRGLLGKVRPQLRAASIEADPFAKMIRLRFEYDGLAGEDVREGCSCAATEVIADFPEPWQLDEQHVARLPLERCSPLEHLVYSRHESPRAA